MFYGLKCLPICLDSIYREWGYLCLSIVDVWFDVGNSSQQQNKISISLSFFPSQSFFLLSFSGFLLSLLCGFFLSLLSSSFFSCRESLHANDIEICSFLQDRQTSEETFLLSLCFFFFSVLLSFFCFFLLFFTFSFLSLVSFSLSLFLALSSCSPFSSCLSLFF